MFRIICDSVGSARPLGARGNFVFPVLGSSEKTGDWPLCEIAFLEAGERGHRRKVMDDHVLVLDCGKAFFAQAPDHPVDVRLAEPEYIRH
jgi:hypothetical protein